MYLTMYSLSVIMNYINYEHMLIGSHSSPERNRPEDSDCIFDICAVRSLPRLQCLALLVE